MSRMRERQLSAQLKELARDSFGIPDCEGAYSALLLMYLDQLQTLQDGAVSLEHRIGELFSQFDSTFTSITGIGPVLAAVILSEIRDISCFASADKLAAYAGLNPKVKQSGETKSSAGNDENNPFVAATHLAAVGGLCHRIGAILSPCRPSSEC